MDEQLRQARRVLLGAGDEALAVLREVLAARPALWQELFAELPGKDQYELLLTLHEGMGGMMVDTFQVDIQAPRHGLRVLDAMIPVREGESLEHFGSTSRPGRVDVRAIVGTRAIRLSSEGQSITTRGMPDFSREREQLRRELLHDDGVPVYARGMVIQEDGSTVRRVDLATDEGPHRYVVNGPIVVEQAPHVGRLLTPMPPAPQEGPADPARPR